MEREQKSQYLFKEQKMRESKGKASVHGQSSWPQTWLPWCAILKIHTIPLLLFSESWSRCLTIIPGVSSSHKQVPYTWTVWNSLLTFAVIKTKPKGFTFLNRLGGPGAKVGPALSPPESQSHFSGLLCWRELCLETLNFSLGNMLSCRHL